MNKRFVNHISLVAALLDFVNTPKGWKISALTEAQG